MPKLNSAELQNLCLESILTFDFVAQTEWAALHGADSGKAIKEFREAFLREYHCPEGLTHPVLFNPALVLGQLYIFVVLAYEVLGRNRAGLAGFHVIKSPSSDNKGLLWHLRNALSHGRVEIDGKWNFKFHDGPPNKREDFTVECSFRDLHKAIKTMGKLVAKARQSTNGRAAAGGDSNLGQRSRAGDQSNNGA